MRRSAGTTRAVLLGTAVVLATGACGGASTPTRSVSNAGSAAGPAGGELDLARVLAALPLDADLVVSLSNERLRANAMARDQSDAALADRMPFDLKAECGIEVGSDLDQMIVAVRARRELYGAMSGLERAPLLACLETARPRLESMGGELVIDTSGAWLTTGTRTFGLAFIAEAQAMFLAVEGTDVDRSVLDAMVAATPGRGLTGSPVFMEMVETVSTDAGLWMMVNGAAIARYAGFVAGVLPPMDAALVSADLTETGLALDVSLRTDSDGDAASFVAGLGAQVRQLAASGVATRADIVADGPDVDLRIEMTDAQLERLATIVKKLATPGSIPIAVPPPPPPPVTTTP